MRNRILLGSVILSVVLLATGCRKYPDGPNFSFIPKEQRVANNWVVDQLYRNDIEETELYDAYSMVFTEGGRLTWTLDLKDEDPVTVAAAWELASVKEQLKLTYDEKDPVSGETRLLYMDILRLTEDEMWLYFLSDGDYYLLRLRGA